MKLRSWGCAHQALLLLTLVAPAVGVRSSRWGACRGGCQNGGLCLPHTGVDSGPVEPQAWACFCRSPWVGPHCTERLDGGPQGELALGGSQTPPPESAQSERQRLERRLHSLQQGLQELRASAKRPEYRLRWAFLHALCGKPHCPLGLRLQNFRVVDIVGPAAHLAVSPGPGTASLEEIRSEVVRQLGQQDSALRRAGGTLMDSRQSQLGLWFTRPGMGQRPLQKDAALAALGAQREQLKHSDSAAQVGHPHSDYELRIAFFRALCPFRRQCAMGLTLNNFQVMDSSEDAVHLTLRPSSRSLPLTVLQREVERQLADDSSPLRRMGGMLMEFERSTVSLWLPRATATQVLALARVAPPTTSEGASNDQSAEAEWGLAAGTFREQQPEQPAAESTNETSQEDSALSLDGPATLADTNTSASDLAGIKENAADDLNAFLSALGLNSAVVCGCLLTVSVLRRFFPTVYEYNREMKANSFFGWVAVAYYTTPQEVFEKAGLDRAMLVEFANLSMRILIFVGAPLVTVVAPLHYYCGGNAAGDDKLSWFSMGNVEQGSWLCWVHACVVWYVVVATQKIIFVSMRRDFIPRRFTFLKNMPDPRATTVLVETIPRDICTEQALRKYFDEEVFGRSVVKHAFFVKQTEALKKMIKKVEKAKEITNASRLRGDTDPQRLARLEKMERDAEREVEELRAKINASDHENVRNAFVTFANRRDAAIALKMFSPDDAEEIVVTIPPDPSDVIWTDFLVDPNLQTCRELFGLVLVAGLMVFFMPIVVYIARIASLNNVKDTVPFFEVLVVNYPRLATLWNGLVGSAALSFMMSMLPTFLVLIFSNLFVLRAEAWTQLYLQATYFYFLVLYVLLVTAIGSSLIETAKFIARRPMEVFVILADKMPSRTHFYLNYITMQWATHAVNLLRYVNLIKFGAFSLVYDKKLAKESSEPEDQDYYGMGSRSARFALMLVTCLVFCSLSPLIVVLGFVNFFLTRIFYSYLFVYSEQSQADLGGIFWFEQLKHVQHGLWLYVTLMTGVLLERAGSVYPAFIAFFGLVYSVYQYRYFQREFRWELLEFHELKGQASKELKGVYYKQPELISALQPGPNPQPKGVAAPADTAEPTAYEAMQARLQQAFNAQPGAACCPGGGTAGAVEQLQAMQSRLAQAFSTSSPESNVSGRTHPTSETGLARPWG